MIFLEKKPAAHPSFKHIPPRIQNFIRELEAYRQFSPQVARQLLQSSQIQEEDLQEWADFEHPAADSYGRKLVYDGGFFEVMVMSWLPGDFSAIHDHGYTQWGAVQVFGPAEHAVFMVQDGQISTLNRIQLKPGHVMAVGHDLVHQMGNSGETPFLSLHVYGNYERKGGITDEARLFDLASGELLRTSGGVFYALPDEKIQRREQAPEADFATSLRDLSEKLSRLLKMQEAGEKVSEELSRYAENLFLADHWHQLLEELEEKTDPSGHVTEPSWWKLLFQELRKAARLQKEEFRGMQASDDPFATYARLYDAVIGEPCLKGFMQDNWRWAAEKVGGLQDKKMLSVGCGTAVVEAWLQDEYGLQAEQLLGIDVSEAMVHEAQKRIPARVGDLLKPASLGKDWDMVYSGLNVLQYVPQARLKEAIQNIASVTKKGGYFLGDFITPDHIRWYPNVIVSKDQRIISLRSPELVEKNNFTYQESEIINLRIEGSQFYITHEGRHLRYLPPLARVRQHFEQAFGGPVEVVDAVSLQPIDIEADTSPSTRYLLLAQKA